MQASWNVAAEASTTASLACVPKWHEDFRNDLACLDVPTLVIHGDADRIVPFKASGAIVALSLPDRCDLRRHHRLHSASFCVDLPGKCQPFGTRLHAGCRAGNEN